MAEALSLSLGKTAVRCEMWHLAESSSDPCRHRVTKAKFGAVSTPCQIILTSLTSRLPRSRPYFATTGRSTSVTGLVGLALSPTDRLIGTRSSLGDGAGKHLQKTHVSLHWEMSGHHHAEPGCSTRFPGDPVQPQEGSSMWKQVHEAFLG